MFLAILFYRCACDPGWTLDKIGVLCTPHCEQPCLNGECTGPDHCSCKPGYIKDIRYAAGNICVAFCPGGCVNGQCSAPNFCLCNPGFVKDRSVKGGNVCVKRARRSVVHYSLIPEGVL